MANDVSLLLDAGNGIEARAAADVVVPVLGVTPLAVVGALSTPNLLGALPDLFEGSDALARLYFGVKADAVLAADGTVTGTDNAGPANAYSLWCRARGRPFRLPPGNYLTSQTISVWTDVEAAGARIIMRYAANAIAFTVQSMPGDENVVPLTEVASWTGWKRRAKALGGLTGRRGEYISVVTNDQVLIPRMSSPQWRAGTAYAVGSRVVYRGVTQTCTVAHTASDTFDPSKWSAGALALSFAEGFRVADDTGTLANMLYGDATNAAWMTGDFLSKKIRQPITVSGLRIVFAKPTGTPTGVAGSGVTNYRPNTNFVDCQIENLSGLEIAEGFSDNRVCNVSYDRCVVKALYVNATNYAFGSSFSAGISYRNCWEEYCRRGIDANRSKDIDIQDCDLPDGWGAHYAWWMSARGGSAGASTASNPQIFNLSGGGFSVTDCRLALTGAATAVARLRSDMPEMGDALILSGCPISIDVPAAQAFVCDVQGLAAGFDALRPIEYPRAVSVENCPVQVRGETTILRILNWGVEWTAAQQPQSVIWNSRFSWQRSPVLFPEGGPVLPNGALRVEIRTGKPTNVTGSGLELQVSGLPVLSLSMVTSSAVYDSATPPNLVRAEGATTTGRVFGRIDRIDGLAFVKYFYGAFSKLVIDAGSLNHSPVIAAPNQPIGDEAVRENAVLAYGQSQAEATLPSAATTDLGKAISARVAITGTTPITSFGTAINRFHILRFTGALTLTHNATSLILPGAANILSAAGDTAIAVSDASGNWRVIGYQCADGSGSPATLTSVDVITSTGSWTKPSWARDVTLVLVGGGGGGGSGRRGAAGSGRGGGGGGGAGALVYGSFAASELAATLTVEVGAGGAGGAAATADNTNGNAGSDGGNSRVSSSGATVLLAARGTGGAAGSTGSAAGGTPLAGYTLDNGGFGAGGSGQAGPGSGGQNGTQGPGGAGGGGGLTSADAPGSGASGGFSCLVGRTTSSVAGGAAPGGSGVDGNPKPWARGFGGSGGGGAAGNAAGTVAGGSGGAGAAGGGAGGGGGGSTNGANSGAGGNGARGEVFIISRG